MSYPRHSSGVVEVDGVLVPYIDAGLTAVDRRTLVLLHGAGGSASAHFSYLFSMLAFRQRVVTLDFQRPKSGPANDAAFVRQVRAVIDKLFPQQEVALLGYGYGAVIAATLASEAVYRVDPLILVCGWLRSGAAQSLREEVWRALRQTDAASSFLSLTELSAPYLTQFGNRLPSRSIRRDLFDAQLTASRSVDLRPAAEKIEARTLVIAATYDQVVPVVQAKHLFGAIRDARYAEISSGHALHIERPAELFQHVDEFMEAPSAQPAGTLLEAARH